MARLGIGPWPVHTFSPKTVEDMTYRGAPADSAVEVVLGGVSR
jgi:hypothetical protein